MPDSLEQRLDELRASPTAPPTPQAFLAQVRRRRWQRRTPALVVLAAALCTGAIYLSTPSPQPPAHQPAIAQASHSLANPPSAACTLAALRHIDPFSSVDLPSPSVTTTSDPILTPLAARSLDGIDLAAR